MAGSIQTWANPLPGAVSTDLELIFNSLTQWLSAPTFLNGVTVGNGTGLQTGDGSGVTTTLVNTNPSTTAPTDTSTPGTPVVTALGGVRSVLAFWPSITTANGSPVANYVAEISTVNTFVSLVQTLNPVGPVASFDNLVANTAYFVRVAAVSYVGNQGPWSTTASVTTPQIAAGDISANTITAGSAIIGTAAISSAQIASLVAGKITAGTINAQTIQLGASGGTAALQSTNYVTGTTGWAIKGDGSAEVTSVTMGTTSGHQTVVDGSGVTINDAGTVDLVLRGNTFSAGFSPPYIQGNNSGVLLLSSSFSLISSAASLSLTPGGVAALHGPTGVSLTTPSDIGLTLGGTAGVNGNGIVACLTSSLSPQPLIQVGSFNATILSGGVQVSSAVTFPVAFPNVCNMVFLNVMANTHNYSASASSFLTTGFTWDMFTTNAATVGADTTWTVNWIAVGH